MANKGVSTATTIQSNPNVRIPLVDLKAQYASIRREVDLAVQEVIGSQSFIQGPPVKAFERAFSNLIGAPHGIGCSNGTAALALILEAMSIKPGDEVITVAHTFVATAEAIRHVGAVPVFVDIEPGAYTLDPVKAEAAITPRTRAILAVHIYGTPCNMTALGALAARHELHLIEDAAQAHLATWQGRYAGTLGAAAGFSFYPGKNLGAYGDAGFVACADGEIARRVRKLCDHGRSGKYEHDLVGYNHRMDSLQAAVLLAKLPHLEAWTKKRRSHAARYDGHLRKEGFKVVSVPGEAKSAYHLYVVEVANRAEVQHELQSAGAATGIHYPTPLHLQPAMAFLGYRKGQLPISERVSDRILSLPLYPELAEDDVDYICESFLRVARSD